MPFFSIRYRNNTLRRSRKSRPSSLPSEAPPPDHTSFLVRYDALPSRSPSGHALDYHSYIPSRYYHPPKQKPLRRPRLSNNLDTTPSDADPSSDIHLNFGSKTAPSTTQRRSRPAPSASNTAASSASSSTAVTVAVSQPLSVSHAIRLKVAQLRRHMGRAHQLGDLDNLRVAVREHRADLATLGERRTALSHLLRDACLVAGLPPPAGVDGVIANSASTNTGMSSVSPTPSVTGTSTSIAGSSTRADERAAPPPQPPPPRRGTATIRSIGGRTISALKGRAWTSRSSSNTLGTLDEPARPNRKSTAVSSPDPSPPPLIDDPDRLPTPPSSVHDGAQPGSHFTPNNSAPGSLSRKSSGRLRRFGSTGTVFLRRLGRAPPSTSPKAVMAPGRQQNVITPPPTISTPFDQQTLTKLTTDPSPLLDEYRASLARLRAEESSTNVALAAAEQKLDHRRHEHRMAMSILDHFYGAQPGWQNDPIANHMFTDTVDMTEAGLQAERDLVDARRMSAQSHAAASDAELAHVSLQRVGVSVAGFADALEAFANNVRDFDGEGRKRSRGSSVISGYQNGKAQDGEGRNGRNDVSVTLQELEMRLDRAVRATEVAGSTCADAPRVEQLKCDLTKLREGFKAEVMAVGTLGRVYRKDMMAMVGVARSAVVDCKLAEAFMRERMRLIAVDVEQFNVTMEKCEEYVMMERMTLVDLHYSEREDGRGWRAMDGD